jgi:uncharacterized membrane protein YdcZ (DUF606 family)
MSWGTTNAKLQKARNLRFQKLELLTTQYKILSDDIRQLESMSEKVLSVGFALISASVAYAYKEGIKEIYFVATPAYLGLLLFISNQYNSVFWKGGHKRYLEDEINQLVGKPTLIWESIAHNSRKRITLANAMFGTFVVGFLAAMFVTSFLQIQQKFSSAISMYFVTACTLLLLCVVISVMQGSGRYMESFRASHSFGGSE